MAALSEVHTIALHVLFCRPRGTFIVARVPSSSVYQRGLELSYVGVCSVKHIGLVRAYVTTLSTTEGTKLGPMPCRKTEERGRRPILRDLRARLTLHRPFMGKYPATPGKAREDIVQGNARSR